MAYEESALTKELNAAVTAELKDPPLALTGAQRRQIERGIASFKAETARIASEENVLKQHYRNLPLDMLIHQAWRTNKSYESTGFYHFRLQLAYLQMAVDAVRGEQLSAEISGTAVTPASVETVHQLLKVGSYSSHHDSGKDPEFSMAQVQRLFGIPRDGLTLEAAVQALLEVDAESATDGSIRTPFTNADVISARSAMAESDPNMEKLEKQRQQLTEPKWDTYRQILLNKPTLAKDVRITLDAYVSNKEKASAPKGASQSLGEKLSQVFKRGKASAGTVNYTGTVGYCSGHNTASQAGEPISIESVWQVATAMATQCALSLQKKGMSVQVMPRISGLAKGAPPDLSVDGISLKPYMGGANGREPFFRYDLTLPLLYNKVAMDITLESQLRNLTERVIPALVEAVRYGASEYSKTADNRAAVRTRS